MTGAPTSSDCDVAIVGYGPVGQTAAILLGRLGHSVSVFERWPAIYPRPRAVHYDDEVARVFQRIGVAEQLGPITEPATTYEWQNAEGQTLLLLDRTAPGPSGWPGATMFSQPELERVLDRTAKALPTVRVHQGWEVSELAEVDRHVRLRLGRGEVGEGGWTPTGEQRTITASYVVGCDGANSLVRETMATPVEDLGFAYDWLIADTIPCDPGLLAGVNLQRCDPRRPTTLVSGGPGRRRWEWMLLPGESSGQFEDEEIVWRLLARSGVGPEEVSLERHAVYTFRARWAECWRAGRMLLAGDAAHQMPPFAGQGLCSGIRDAATLAWQLDLVLGGHAGEHVLDAYTSERRAHLQHAIAISVELGKVICITNEAEAAARDEVLLGVAADPTVVPSEPPPPKLGPGIHDGSSPAGGSLFPQGRVVLDGRSHLLEDTLEWGFALYALGTAPRELLGGEDRELLGGLACNLVALDASCDPIYRDWFAHHDCEVALVRPDGYVFATAEATTAATSALVEHLRTALIDPDRSEERLTT